MDTQEKVKRLALNGREALWSLPDTANVEALGIELQEAIKRKSVLVVDVILEGTPTPLYVNGANLVSAAAFERPRRSIGAGKINDRSRSSR